MILQLQKVIGWISVIIHCLSKPIHSVTELAGLWTLLRTQCIAPYSTLFPEYVIIPIRYEYPIRVLFYAYSELNSLKNLQPLDRDVQHCLFFAKVHDKYLESGFSSVHCAPADIPTPLKVRIVYYIVGIWGLLTSSTLYETTLLLYSHILH